MTIQAYTPFYLLIKIYNHHKYLFVFILFVFILFVYVPTVQYCWCCTVGAVLLVQ
ncbi:hypothetical protein [Bacillus sp. 196mf]|uniref:hypothetical protein n=1 Tax=Bacillus sp. 196mf TaxID=1761754 RepID=UPI0015E886A5|nr:hypothetical protein [Bacillus sp. 196mf]